VSRWPNKYVIGLTGNIAVGKSVVRQMLQHLGAYTIDADGLVHQAMSPGAPAYKPVVETFGQFILNPDKTINRAMLGSIVFSNVEALQKLEAITHPIIGQAINTLISRAKQRVVVIEAIKLLEGDLAQSVNAVWVVDARPQTQYTRLVGKRKMPEQDAKQRMLAQSGQDQKLKAAHVVINNDGNIEDTWKQVQAAWKKVLAEFQPAPKPAPAAQPKPGPAAPAAEEAAEEAAPAPPAGVSGVTIKRGMPANAEDIASFINQMTGQSISRMDIIMAFGQKSYLLAQNQQGATIGAVGWQVENLITRADELYIAPDAPKDAVVYSLVRAIEDASRELQSEVSFIFLPDSTEEAVLQPFFQSGYEATTITEIKIPAWREAVQEVAAAADVRILTKKLRKDRVLKPI
jgi:dephospho-CoA kinase